MYVFTEDLLGDIHSEFEYSWIMRESVKNVGSLQSDFFASL